jgi:hypothetical protein
MNLYAGFTRATYSYPNRSLGFQPLSDRKQATAPRAQSLPLWRRERDSNPRASFRRPIDLANRPLQPLGYLSTNLNCVAVTGMNYTRFNLTYQSKYFLRL